MKALRDFVEQHQFLIRLLGFFFVAGMAWQRIPSNESIKAISDNLTAILAEQRKEIDGAKIAIMQRLTRAEVKAMLDSPDNPWISAAPAVMPVINRYENDRLATQELLLQIRGDLRVLRESAGRPRRGFAE